MRISIHHLSKKKLALYCKDYHCTTKSHKPQQRNDKTKKAPSLLFKLRNHPLKTSLKIDSSVLKSSASKCATYCR